MKNLIKNLFNQYNFNLTEAQISQFEKFYNLLIEENKKINLTAITEEKEVVLKHFIDSVLPVNEIEENAKVVDIGSGAGFPGIPLKILRPDLKITLVDSLQKRVNFLNMVINELSLNDINAVHARAEDFCKENREFFDIALSRAVAQIPTLAEYLIPFVKKGGKVLMYKGSKANEEVLVGQKAIQLLGGKIKKTLEYDIEEIDAKRFIIIIDKINNTNKIYPRSKNLPKTKPIL